MRVSVVVPLCNRGRLFTKCVESMDKALGPDDELVVADYESDDIDVKKLLEEKLPGRHYLATIKRPFRICRGLNSGAMVAKGDIIFFTHADCIHPPGLCDTVASKVSPGTVYFPIFGWLPKHPPGKIEWSPGAFGIVGVHRSDLLDWNESMDARWGYQDNDYRNRMVATGKKLIRERIEGLLHVWHDHDRAALQKHYAQSGAELANAPPYPKREA